MRKERETWLQANEAAVDFIEQKALENHIADEAMESVLGRVL
jgi:hypothetical protein